MQPHTSLLGRVLVIVIGTMLVLVPVGSTLLLMVGKGAPAKVNLRRIGGSDSGRTPEQRYEWALDYSFRTEDGTLHEGHATRRGPDLGIKVKPKIVYLPSAPMINALEQDLQPGIGQLVLLACGGILLHLGFKRRSHRLGKAAKRPPPT